MVIEYLECNYICGTPFTLAFHNKIEHKDKISKCACGDEPLSGICFDGAAWHATDGVRLQISGTTSNCSCSGSKSSSISNSSSSSISSSITNSSSSSSPSSSSNSSSSPNSYSNSNSNSGPSSSSNSNSSSKSSYSSNSSSSS